MDQRKRYRLVWVRGASFFFVPVACLFGERDILTRKRRDVSESSDRKQIQDLPNDDCAQMEHDEHSWGQRNPMNCVEDLTKDRGKIECNR